MCIARPPDPKPAPAPPSRADASLAAAEEQRRQAQGRQGTSANILTRLSDSDVEASARKKKLGEG